MAILDIDLGSGDRTIDSGNFSAGDTVRITALGSHTLTVDGVDVILSKIIGLKAAAAPTFEAINGGALTLDHGLLDASVLSGVTYSVHDTSSIAVDSASVSGQSDLLSPVTVDFHGDADTDFSYIPAPTSLLPPMVFEVHGMESLDQLVIAGRTDLGFRYDSASRTGTVTSNALLGQDVTCNIHSMSQAQADMALAGLADPSSDARIGDSIFTFPVCLAAGTRVLTPHGARPCEDLEVGDRVVTADRGAQPIRWIGRITLDVHNLAEMPQHRPIRIRTGSLGPDAPSRDLLVSPQHRLLISPRIAERLFDRSEVLVPASKLLELPGIDVDDDVASVTYMHLMFDHHEVIYAEHAPVESLLSGPMAIKAMPSEQKEELAEIFPEIFKPDFEADSVRAIPAGRHMRKLVERHRRNRVLPLAS